METLTPSRLSCAHDAPRRCAPSPPEIVERGRHRRPARRRLRHARLAARPAAARGHRRPGWCGSPTSTTAPRRPSWRRSPHASRPACCAPRAGSIEPRRELDEYFGGRRRQLRAAARLAAGPRLRPPRPDAPPPRSRTARRPPTSGGRARGQPARLPRRRQRARRQPAADRRSLPPRAAHRRGPRRLHRRTRAQADAARARARPTAAASACCERARRDEPACRSTRRLDTPHGRDPPFDAYQQRHRWLAIPMAVVKKFGDDQAGNLAALVAYYAFFSMFPLLLVFVDDPRLRPAGPPERRRSRSRARSGVSSRSIGSQIKVQACTAACWPSSSVS